MANYSNLKAAIAAAIKTNGNQEITGQVLQDVLTSMVSVIGANYTFAGVATPATNPGTPDQNVMYLAMEGGTYTNFNGTVLPAGISLLMWSGTWMSETVMYGDGGVFDISVYKSSGGTLATFADLAAALDGGNNIPASARKGGMSVKFVCSSDNKYVQYRLISNTFSTTVSDWEGVDEVPISGSNNLVKSNEIAEIVYIPEELLVSDINSELIVPTNVENNKLLTHDGGTMEIEGYKIISISANAGDSIYIKNTNAFNNFFDFFRIYINNKLVYVKQGGDTKCLKNIIHIKNNCTIQYSIDDLDYSHGRGLCKLTSNNVDTIIDTHLYYQQQTDYIEEFGAVSYSQIGSQVNFYDFGTRQKFLVPAGTEVKIVENDSSNYFACLCDSNGIVKQVFNYAEQDGFIFSPEATDTILYVSIVTNVKVYFRNITIDAIIKLFSDERLQNEKYFCSNNDYIEESGAVNNSSVGSQVQFYNFGIRHKYTVPAKTSVKVKVSDPHYYYACICDTNGIVKQIFNYYDNLDGYTFNEEDEETILYVSVVTNILVLFKDSTITDISEIVGESEKEISSLNNKFLDYQTATNVVLWLGTSIPEGAQYPEYSCEKNGLQCVNNSRGSSYITLQSLETPSTPPVRDFSLSKTVAEFEAQYRPLVTQGLLTEETLEYWKGYSYERLLIPYINGTNPWQASAIVFDHGFNDRHAIPSDLNTIDWSSRDRTTFVGAFNYLLDKIYEEGKFTIKIIISGYFQNKLAEYDSNKVCLMQKMLSEHFGFSLIPTWEHSQITDKYIKGTSNYISQFNTTYGTDYQKWNPDNDGNIMSMQIYCPDWVHPHSDLTGNSDKRLNAIYKRYLRDIL